MFLETNVENKLTLLSSSPVSASSRSAVRTVLKFIPNFSILFRWFDRVFRCLLEAIDETLLCSLSEVAIPASTNPLR